MQKLAQQIDAAKHALADHDQSDYAGLGERMKAITAQEAEVEELELRWFELHRTARLSAAIGPLSRRRK